VKQLADEWTAMSSDLLPDEVKEKASDGSLPALPSRPLSERIRKVTR
jgi:hypothetical protein